VVVTDKVSKVCVVCDGEFIPRRSDAITCSNRCRQSAFRRHKGGGVTVIQPVKVIPGEENEPVTGTGLSVTPIRPDGSLRRKCGQCGAGLQTDPASDAPTIKVGGSWFHPECHAYRQRYR
jgi:hypothetical protein